MALHRKRSVCVFFLGKNRNRIKTKKKKKRLSLQMTKKITVLVSVWQDEYIV